MTRSEPPPIYEFGPFRLDPAERVLFRDRQPVALKPKAFGLLVFLVERPGRLILKQELLDALWAGTFVEEANLTYTVSTLRRALGDGQEGERFIQTVPTRGYRFVAAVSRVAETRPDGGGTPGLAGRRYLLLLILGLAVVLGVTIPLAVRQLGERPSASAGARLVFPLPEGERAYASPPAVQVSPDGRHLAFRTWAQDEGRRLWLRPLDSPMARQMPGTDASFGFSWSPDSRYIAFLTPTENGTLSSLHLKTVDVTGGEIETLCEVPFVRFGSWSGRGTMLFTSLDGGLISVDVAGGRCGELRRLYPSGDEMTYVNPSFLPDGRRFLYQVRSSDPSQTGLYVGSLETDTPVRVPGIDTPGIYAAGHLLFPRDGAIIAQPFDADRLEVRGEGRSLANDGRWLTVRGEPNFSASDTGTFAYAIHSFDQSRFVWVDRSGKLLGTVGDTGPYATFDLSPDGSRLVVNRVEANQANLWILELERDMAVRRTFGVSYDSSPRWAPDGERVASTRRGNGPTTLVEITADGRERFLFGPDPGEGNLALDDWSPDGRFLLFRRLSGPGGLLALPLTEDGDPVLIRQRRAGLIDQASFSPDTRWIVYSSNESGRWEVYIVRFPPQEGWWRISTQGGVQPVWRQDGREIFYLGLDGTLFAVPLTLGDIPRVGRPQPLFATPIVSPSPIIEDYAVAADGQRFLFKTRTQEARTSIGVLIDWPALLRQRVSR